MSIAYDKGYDAGICGANDSENPYPIGSDEAMDWYYGLADGEAFGDD